MLPQFRAATDRRGSSRKPRVMSDNVPASSTFPLPTDLTVPLDTGHDLAV